MKKTLLTLLVALGLSQGAFGFGRFVHATIVYIAEQNLTPEAQENLRMLTDGKSIVHYASYCDTYKNDWKIDLGFKPSNSKRKTTLPHTFSICSDTGLPFEGYRSGDEFVVNLIPFVEEAEQWLKTNKYEKNDSTAFVKMCILLHMIGDMHCFGHIREFPITETSYYKADYMLTVHGQEMKYHTYLDDQWITERYPWSYSDLAHIFDNYTAEERAAFAEGDIRDWAADVYKMSEFTRSFRKGAVVTKADCDRIRLDGEVSIVKAGYRLAKVLNEVFGGK